MLLLLEQSLGKLSCTRGHSRHQSRNHQHSRNQLQGVRKALFSPHGLPLDLLDRLLIIQTKNYTQDEVRQIIETRCEEEDVEMTEEALIFLTEIGMDTTLRYSIQLITTSSLLAAKRKSTEVDVSDIRRAYSMFLDVKRSSDYLKDHQK